MRNNPAFLVFTILAGIILARTGSISAEVKGVVRDSSTNAAISGVTVQVKGTPNQTFTDASGRFSLTVAGASIIDHRVLYNLAGINAESYDVYDMNGRIYNPQPGKLSDGVYVVKAAYGLTGKMVIAGNMIKNISWQGAGPVMVQTQETAAKAAAGPVTMEAEAMALNGYMVDPGRSNMIMVDPNGTGTGTATSTFNGVSGIYNISLCYVPENDGQPQVQLSVGSKQVLEKTYPSEQGYFNCDVVLESTVEGVQVNNGDLITLEGTADSTAYARVDKIVLADVNNVTLVFSKAAYQTKQMDVNIGDTNIVVFLTGMDTSVITHGEQLTVDHVGPWNLQGVAPGSEQLDTPPRPSQGYFRLTEWRSQQLIPDQPFVGSDSDLANLNNPANKGGRLATATMIDGYLIPAGTYVCQFRDLLSIYCQSITSGDYLFRGCRFRNCGNAFNAAYSSGGFHIYIHYSDFGGDGPNDWQDGGGFIQLVGGSNHRVYRCRFQYIATAIQPNVNGVVICENYIDKICDYYGDVGRDGIPGNSDSYHLNGVSCEGGLSSLQILRNKILVPSPDGSVAPSVGAPNRTTPQTDCIALFQSLAGPYPGDGTTGIQVRDNYLGGSGYVIYGGGGEPGCRNVKITGNKITTRWWTNGGNFGPFAYDPGFGTNGNEKANNTWADDYGSGGNGINPTSARQYPLGNGPRQGELAF